jgi:sulfopyruvate decarboxylase alpha subunit
MTPSPASNLSPDWPSDIHQALRAHRVRQVAYVPDAGLARIITLCEDDVGMITAPLTREEEGVAMLAGAALGGERGVLLMQSSGVGNCVNMLSITLTCEFPLLMIVTMRGQEGEFNPWQLPMGEAAAEVLNLMGVSVFPVDDADRAGEIVAAAADEVFSRETAAAVLISQRMIGIKSFEQ